MTFVAYVVYRPVAYGGFRSVAYRVGRSADATGLQMPWKRLDVPTIFKACGRGGTVRRFLIASILFLAANILNGRRRS